MSAYWIHKTRNESRGIRKRFCNYYSVYNFDIKTFTILLIRRLLLYCYRNNNNSYCCFCCYTHHHQRSLVYLFYCYYDTIVSNIVFSTLTIHRSIWYSINRIWNAMGYRDRLNSISYAPWWNGPPICHKRVWVRMDTTWPVLISMWYKIIWILI